MLHIVYAEEFLEAHTADTCNSIQAGKSQSGYTHGHEYGCHINGHTEHFKEACNTAAENLERSTCCCGSVCSGCRTGNTKGKYSQ